MRSFICTCLAVALLTATTIAQNPTKAAASPRPIAPRVFLIAGEVNEDGTILVSQEINKWLVTNAALLKGYAGAHVTVRCHVDPDKHAMQVLSIVRQELVKYNPSDAAFRR
jgi:hypothetical protein